MTDLSDDCTTESVQFRHRPAVLAAPAVNDFLGTLGRRGTTACGEPDALDQPELDMWYAEWGVPKERRAVIAKLPPCSKCYSSPVDTEAQL